MWWTTQLLLGFFLSRYTPVQMWWINNLCVYSPHLYDGIISIRKICHATLSYGLTQHSKRVKQAANRSSLCKSTVGRVTGCDTVSLLIGSHFENQTTGTIIGWHSSNKPMARKLSIHSHNNLSRSYNHSRNQSGLIHTWRPDTSSLTITFGQTWGFCELLVSTYSYLTPSFPTICQRFPVHPEARR